MGTDGTAEHLPQGPIIPGIPTPPKIWAVDKEYRLHNDRLQADEEEEKALVVSRMLPT